MVVADAAADPRPGEIETELLGSERGHRPRHTLALVYQAGHAAPSQSARWLSGRRIDRHVHVRLDRPDDFDRLARLLTGNAVGLALGGGFARGLAHVGVLRALEELRIPVDLIGGSSMGAIVGAQWALGWSAADIARRTSEGLAASFDDKTLPFLSFKRGGKHSRVIRQFFGETRIEDLWLPYFCVSTNLNRSELKVHSAGPLAEAVMASSRAPGVFPPLVMDGELHVDGGVINNVPVDVMRDFSNVGIVIGVDVSPPHELNEVANYGDEVSGWQAAWSRFNPNREKRSYRPSMLFVLMRLIEFGSISYRRQKADMADVCISPDVARFKRNDFQAAADLADVGYRAAREVLTKWLAEGAGAFWPRRPDTARPDNPSGSYSLRNASVGSMRRPRRAGPSEARTPTSSMNAAALGRMPGIGKPPICSIGTYRPTRYAASIPTAEPAPICKKARLNTAAIKWRGGAPRAERIPISRRRCATVNAMSAYRPAAESSSTLPVTAPMVMAPRLSPKRCSR